MRMVAKAQPTMSTFSLVDHSEGGGSPAEEKMDSCKGANSEYIFLRCRSLI